MLRLTTSCLAFALGLAPLTSAGETAPALGVALRATKILTSSEEGPSVIDHGVLLMRGGKIEGVGPARTTEIPEGYEVVDVGEHWLMPGLVELHSHVASGYIPFPADLNDTVYLTNSDLRASASVRPDNSLLRRGVAGGVTTVLYIPGSGSNMGGSGVLLKIGFDTYEDMELRNPGSLKLAQSGNPESWTVNVGRSLMNWNTRHTFLRGKNYARAWSDWEQGKGEKPKVDLQFEVFRDLFAKKTQVSTHTQIYQVVLETLTMVRQELGLDVYLDHGSFDGYRTAALAEELGVPAILGPRQVSLSYPGFIDQEGQIRGMAAEYQAAGHTRIGFNTDCVDNGRFLTPPQEELQLQAGMAMRYGFDGSQQQAVRGLTIIPAKAAGIADRVGSLEVGKDADVVVIDGDPADPRCAVERVYTNGQLVYDASNGHRLW